MRFEESGCLERCSRLMRPGGVVDVEFTRRARAPIVDLDAAREPQAAMRRRAEQGLPERGFGLAEGDRLEAAAVVARDDRADMAVADHIGLDEDRKSTRLNSSH